MADEFENILNIIPLNAELKKDYKTFGKMDVFVKF